MKRSYPIACFDGLSITENLLKEYAAEVGSKKVGKSSVAANYLDGVPNDRVLVLPLRVGKWKGPGVPDETMVDVCRNCGSGIYLEDEHAAFYQGDIRFSMPHKVCLALIAHDVIKDRKER